MKFFFADNLDMVDPTFDFEAETRADWRIRQRDDLYSHEVFDAPPYDGVLVSKAIVDGYGAKWQSLFAGSAPTVLEKWCAGILAYRWGK